MRVLFPWLLAPLTLNVSARDGFDGIECASAGRREAGQRGEQLLIVAADRNRQVLQLARAQLLPHFRPVGLQQRRLGGDRDGFLQLADAERRVDAGDRVERHFGTSLRVNV